MKLNIIYRSGTGNTKQMAECIAQGATKAKADVSIIPVGEASLDDVTNADAVAFGCPAMGSEELEETEMRPFMDEANKHISGKKVALFGSYERAEGEWMRTWQEEIEDTGANLIADGLIAYSAPDDDIKAACFKLGEKLAN